MFVRAANPIWYFVDLVGLGLNDEYYAFFLTNTLPYVPQNVYRDNQGMTVWTNDVVQFYPNGTLPDNLYFDPTLVYRIEIRHGDSQSDPLIYEINDFVPGNGSSAISSSFPILFAENQISNSNFSNVNFATTIASPDNPVMVITTAGTYQIAPDWDLILTGAGTTTLTQQIYSGSGILNSPNALNYSLRIANTGWSTAVLSQRFSNNGAIFGSGAISASVVARGIVSAQVFSLSYVPSVGAGSVIISNATALTGNFRTYSGTINLPDSTNTDTSTTAYVDIQLNLPVSGTMEITDVQIVGQNSQLIDTSTNMPFPVNTDIPTVRPGYQQQSQERILDQLFHHYADSIITQPKSTIVTGWQFPLNPWQFTTTTVTNVAANQYTADQTIVIQQAYVTSATANNVAVGRGTNIENYSFQVNPVTAHNQFAIVQYIASQTARPFWTRVLSSRVRCGIRTTHGTKVAMKMRLIYKASAPGTVSQADPIVTWVEGSDPVFAAGYTAIAPIDDPVFVCDDNNSEFSFNGFQLPASSNDNMTLGIVFYSVSNMDQTATADNFFIGEVSLVENDFGIFTNPKTYDQVLQECQYYYEKSYNAGNLPGAVTVIGVRTAPLRVSYVDNHTYLNSFSFVFDAEKRAIPATISFWTPPGLAANVQAHALLNGVDVAGSPADVAITNWALTGASTRSALLVCQSSNSSIIATDGNVGNEAYMSYHYVVDVRLGV